MRDSDKVQQTVYIVYIAWPCKCDSYMITGQKKAKSECIEPHIDDISCTACQHSMGMMSRLYET